MKIHVHIDIAIDINIYKHIDLEIYTYIYIAVDIDIDADDDIDKDIDVDVNPTSFQVSYWNQDCLFLVWALHEITIQWHSWSHIEYKVVDEDVRWTGSDKII